MTKTQFFIMLGVVVIAIIATAFTVNSCNNTPQDAETTKLEELVIQHLNKSDSLQKVAIDSMLAITARDSAHHTTINNIFNNSIKSKNEIIKTLPDSKRVADILRWADSIAVSNKQPNTAW